MPFSITSRYRGSIKLSEEGSHQRASTVAPRYSHCCSLTGPGKLTQTSWAAASSHAALIDGLMPECKSYPTWLDGVVTDPLSNDWI